MPALSLVMTGAEERAASAVNLAARHQLLAAPTQAPPALSGSGVSMAVLVIMAMGFAAWYLMKHKKVKPGPAAVFFALGLAMSGTQIGTMVAQLLASLGQMLNSFIGSV